MALYSDSVVNTFWDELLLETVNDSRPRMDGTKYDIQPSKRYIHEIIFRWEDGGALN